MKCFGAKIFYVVFALYAAQLASMVHGKPIRVFQQHNKQAPTPLRVVNVPTELQLMKLHDIWAKSPTAIGQVKKLGHNVYQGIKLVGKEILNVPNRVSRYFSERDMSPSFLKDHKKRMKTTSENPDTSSSFKQERRPDVNTESSALKYIEEQNKKMNEEFDAAIKSFNKKIYDVNIESPTLKEVKIQNEPLGEQPNTAIKPLKKEGPVEWQKEREGGKIAQETKQKKNLADQEGDAIEKRSLDERLQELETTIKSFTEISDKNMVSMNKRLEKLKSLSVEDFDQVQLESLKILEEQTEKNRIANNGRKKIKDKKAVHDSEDGAGEEYKNQQQGLKTFEKEKMIQQGDKKNSNLTNISVMGILL